MNAFRLDHRVWTAFTLIAAMCLSARELGADDLKDGRTALQANRLDEAMKSFEKAASQGFAEGRAGVGLVWLKRGRSAQAMEAFQQSQRMDPNLAVSYYGQGEVLRRQDKCEQALPLLNKAVDLDRKFPEAQLSLGDCYVRTKNYDAAFKALTPGLKWGSKWEPRFLVALGDAELARDSLRDAGIYYTKAREKAPNDAAPRRALGDFYIKRGTFELAVPEYRAAVALDSTDVELRLALGRALFYAQQYNEALEVYRDVVARDPEFPPGQLALGDLYYRSGTADRRRFSDARGPLELYVKLEPTDARGWSVLGRTYYQLGMKDEALEAMKKAESLGDKSKEMYTFRARAHVDRKEWDEALKFYAMGAPEPQDQLKLAQIFVNQGQPGRAESLYTQLIEQDSTSWNGKFAMMEMGKLRYRDKNFPAAVSWFLRLTTLDQSQGDAYYFLGLSLKEMKQPAEAVGALRRAAELSPDRPDRHFWLGMMYAELDSAAAARRELNQAVQLDTSGTAKNTGFALRQLGYYDLLGRNYNEAVRLLERSVTINPGDIQAWIWYAQGNHNAGNRGKACEAYDRALALDPSQTIAVKGKKALGCPQSP
jgi:tetratricopeptide (TPR) repeat protein